MTGEVQKLSRSKANLFNNLQEVIEWEAKAEKSWLLMVMVNA